MSLVPAESESKIHCVNLLSDRNIGAKWERNFCCLAARYGFVFTPMQIGRSSSAQAYFVGDNGTWHNLTLPDITIWNAPGMHHEIKHKNPTRAGMYGLEEYRLLALLDFKKLVGQNVYYTIHDHDLAGGKNVEANKIDHWRTAEAGQLQKHVCTTDKGNSWVNGQKRSVIRLYWETSIFAPLSSLFELEASKIATTQQTMHQAIDAENHANWQKYQDSVKMKGDKP